MTHYHRPITTGINVESYINSAVILQITVQATFYITQQLRNQVSSAFFTPISRLNLSLLNYN